MYCYQLTILLFPVPYNCSSIAKLTYVQSSILHKLFRRKTKIVVLRLKNSKYDVEKLLYFMLNDEGCRSSACGCCSVIGVVEEGAVEVPAALQWSNKYNHQ